MGIREISVQPSVTLQHLPYDLSSERGLPAELAGRLAFACQKLGTIVELAGLGAAGAGAPWPTVDDPSSEIERSLFSRAEPFGTRRDKQVGGGGGTGQPPARNQWRY